MLNNGIAGYVEYLNEENKIRGNCLAVGMLGMQFFYMEKDFYAGQFTKTIYPKEKALPQFNSRIASYFITLLNKFQSTYQGVLVRDFEETFYKSEILLPLKNDKIDIDYIEAFITELQAERLQELQAERLQELQGYLQATGLSNYTLTAEEQHAIDELNHLIEQESFVMSDIFDIATSVKKFNAKDLSFGGIYPYVARTEKDNGIRGYVTEDKKYLNPANTISFGQDTATMFYQKEAYFTGDKIKIFSLKGKELNRSIALYLITMMRKSFSVFSWGSMFNESVLNNTKIHLPIKNKLVDYEKMEVLISAIQKLVIADVVKYTDRELLAYQNVIA